MIRNRLTPLEYDPGSVVYQHVRRIVGGMIKKAVGMGYDWLEVESAANLGFAVAVESYSADKGEFVAWVKRKVRYAILDTRRKGNRPLPLSADPDLFDPADPESETDEEPAFDLTAVLLGLSDDARAWVSLVLDPPDAVRAKAAELGWDAGGQTRGIEAAKYRQAVYSFLRGSGWSNRRIDAAYKEACDALGRNERAD